MIGQQQPPPGFDPNNPVHQALYGAQQSLADPNTFHSVADTISSSASPDEAVTKILSGAFQPKPSSSETSSPMQAMYPQGQQQMQSVPTMNDFFAKNPGMTPQGPKAPEQPKHPVALSIFEGLQDVGANLMHGTPPQATQHRLARQQEQQENYDKFQEAKPGLMAGIYKESQQPVVAQNTATALAGYRRDTLEQKGKIAGDKNATMLRKSGYTQDAEGNISAIPRDQLSAQEQSKLDLNDAMDAYHAAQTEVAKSKNDPNSPAFKQAQAKLSIAAQNASIAAGRLNLSSQEFERDTFGTYGGQAIAGAPTDESGKAIGLKVANAGNPSADRLRRGDLARNATENIDAVTGLITKRPDLFGAISGRFTSVAQMVGSDDPAIQEIGIRLHNAALASNGAHGLRSAQAVADTENVMLNHFKAGQPATLAGLAAMKDSLSTFINDEKLGKRAAPAIAPPGGKAKDPLGIR